jgi:hypothetical protein
VSGCNLAGGRRWRQFLSPETVGHENLLVARYHGMALCYPGVSQGESGRTPASRQHSLPAAATTGGSGRGDLRLNQESPTQKGSRLGMATAAQPHGYVEGSRCACQSNHKGC